MGNLRKCRNLHDRIGDDIGNGRIIVSQAIDEGRVGTILKKPPHKIGQQVLMAADRRIDTARQIHFCGTHHLLIERLPHAVQPLEFIAPLLTRHDPDRRNRVGVMRGKLRIECGAVGQHEFGAGQIAHIG